jgi:selenide, water dikinase
MKLTQYSHASGCGCKMAPADLEKLLSGKKVIGFDQLLVGNHSNDDAAVWDLGNGQAMVSTVDFFMPIVDDAFDFGRIAAANAISDVYAMGGKPIFANAILGWPIDLLPVELASKVMDGAREVCAQAGIPIAGGHTIDSKEPMFGLAVNGLVQTENIKRNNTPQEGDLLLLTKPLGTGIMGTAIRRGMQKENHAELVIRAMCQLNDVGAKLAQIPGVHAMTDVTGFGLIGHLLEMCGEMFSAELLTKQIPYFDFLKDYMEMNIIPDNTYRNWNSWEKKVSGLSDMKWFQLLNDPQTSGGLLISVDPNAYDAVRDILIHHGLSNFVEPIGEIKPRGKSSISIL